MDNNKIHHDDLGYDTTDLEGNHRSRRNTNESNSSVPRVHSAISVERTRHEMELEDKKLENTWTSCCFQVSRPMVSYITQAVVLSGVIVFSCVQLANGAEPQSLYVGLLSSSIGLLIPTGPGQDKKDK